MNIKAVAAVFVTYVGRRWLNSYVILTTSKPNIVVMVYQNKSAVIDSSFELHWHVQPPLGQVSAHNCWDEEKNKEEKT